MNGVEKTGSIIVHDASENNLKHITVSFPLEKFACVTGPSGCGKSSLVYDTLYAESQRTLYESLAGNMFGKKLLDKPKVDYIENLRPALDISQKCYNVNPRSTVGTFIDISYYIRSVFALIYNYERGEEVDMNYFSPNNPNSCCRVCKGTGEEYVVSMQALIPDKTKRLADGGITYYKGSKNSFEYKLLEEICKRNDIDMAKRVMDLTEAERYQLLYKEEPESIKLRFKSSNGKYRQKIISRRGAVCEIKEKLKKIEIPSFFINIAKYLEKVKCSICNGMKLKNDILAIHVAGYNISQIESLSVSTLSSWTDNVKSEFKNKTYFNNILCFLSKIEEKKQKLLDLGLGYIALGRSIPSLSGGELQRVRFAKQLGCNLSGLLYIFDEPCKGLHYRNVRSIIDSTFKLINSGNTVIAIEHNPQYMSNAQKIIEMGPVGGPQGGYIIKEKLGKNDFSYDIKFKKKGSIRKKIIIEGIKYHNLKQIDIDFPIGKITCMTGVSGAGKTSAAYVIEEACKKGNHEHYLRGYNLDAIANVIHIDQKPIGKTPRSTIVSYLDIYDEIRDLFAGEKAAKKLGLTPSAFSMNVKGGRCEICQGTGRKKIELSYLPDQFITCPECKGKRFNQKILSVRYKGYSIDDLLNSSIDNIINLFNDRVCSLLECVIKLGIGYLSLGQMSMNLSGGEAQRIKLARCLGKQGKKCLYILDEPTSGLSAYDIKVLECVLNELVDKGETLLIIDHNPEFIGRVADYLIDFGTLSGEKGGKTILLGTPESVMTNKHSSWHGLIHKI